MKIKNLDIRDMGIIQGGKLEDLDEGVVVLGGLNRAGKSTFMEVIRHLPYGFKSNENIPKPKFNYDIRAEIIGENKESFNMFIKGYGEPQLFNAENKKIDTKEVWGSIDRYTYNQVFTISLEELSSLSQKDQRLQGALLGAGFNQLIEVPALVNKFKKKGEEIGGTKGDCKVKMFKPYSMQISKALELKNEFKEKLKKYGEIKIQLENLEIEIKEKEDILERAYEESCILEAIQNSFELYKDYEKFQSKIKTLRYDGIKDFKNMEYKGEELLETYEELSRENEAKIMEYEKKISEDILNTNIFLENEEAICTAHMKSMSSQERIENLFKHIHQHEEKKKELLEKLNALNGEYTEFHSIRNLNFDESQIEVVQEYINEYHKINEKKVVLENSLEGLQEKIELLNNELKDYETLVKPQSIKSYIVNFLCFLLLGITISYFSIIPGMFFIALGAVISWALFMYRHVKNLKFHEKTKELKFTTGEFEENLNVKNKELLKIEEDLISKNLKIEEVKENLKLRDDIPLEELGKYISNLMFIKEMIIQNEEQEKNLIKEFNSLKEELEYYKELIKKFSNKVINLKEDADSISDYKVIFKNIEIIYEDLSVVLELNETLKNKYAHEEKVIKELGINFTSEDFVVKDNSIDYLTIINNAIRKGKELKIYEELSKDIEVTGDKILICFKNNKVLGTLNLDEQCMNMENIKKLFVSYGLKEQIISKYDKNKVVEKELRSSLEILKVKSENLKNYTKDFNENNQNFQAENMICEGQRGLKSLGQKYAIYNTTAFIMQRLQDKFLEDTGLNLFRESSNDLEKITTGEVKAIKLKDLGKFAFNTILKNGSIVEDPCMLSTSTAEALFLSLRLSKIKSISPRLPVVFDDTFVNFDIKHVKNMVEIIKDLSKTHQVFILTCHSGLLRLIEDSLENTRYLKIERGNINKSSFHDLYNYLNK